MLIWYMYIEQRELYNHNETKAKFSVIVLNVICSNTFFSFLTQEALV
jgi:type IV secretory pathway component VirB8